MPMSFPEGWFLLILEERNKHTSLHPHPCPVIKTPTSQIPEEADLTVMSEPISVTLYIACP